MISCIAISSSLAAALVLLAGCIENEQGPSPLILTAPATPADCSDALNEVGQAERAFDAGLVGTEHVREAVLADNRLCWQQDSDG